jgi:hypothetical protein
VFKSARHALDFLVGEAGCCGGFTPACDGSANFADDRLQLVKLVDLHSEMRRNLKERARMFRNDPLTGDRSQELLR